MNPNDSNNPNNPFRGFGQYRPPFPQQTNTNPNQQNRPFLNFPFGFPDPNPNPTLTQNVSEAQFAAYAQFIANNPNLVFGGSQAETVPETQPEREAGSSQRARKSKKKAKAPVVLDDEADEEEEEELTMARTRQAWTVQENEALVRAWMERSEDNEIGNYQDGKAFYKKVHLTFVKLLGKDKNYRDFKSIGAHFRDIQGKIQLFQCIYNRIKGDDWHSGESDADIQDRALADYTFHNDTNAAFNYLSCWKLVRDHPKWQSVPPKARARRYLDSLRASKRSKTTSTSNPNTPSDANDINLNDEPDEDAVNLGANNDFVELTRPPGRSKGKAKKGAGSSKAAEVGESHVSSQVTEIIKEHIAESRLTREQLRENKLVHERFVQEMHERNNETKMVNMEKRIKHLRDKGMVEAAEALDAQLTELILNTYQLPK